MSDAPDYLAFAPSRDRPRWGRALLKPLIAIVTLQYAIVTALVAFAAVTVASETARIVNAQLEPIIAALKRL